MPENPQKPAFQRIEKYDLAYLADLVCDSDVERIGEALVDAERAGTKASLDKLKKPIEAEGGYECGMAGDGKHNFQLRWVCVICGQPAKERLKAELEGRK